MSEILQRLLTKEVSQFDCGEPSINEWIKESYYATLLQHGYAYELLYGEIVIGYYMVAFQTIDLAKCPEEISDRDSGLTDYVPCVHIKYLAIDKRFQHHGIGTGVLETIIKGVKELSLYWPVRLITIDALTHLVDWYKREKFKIFPYNEEWQEGYTVKMYRDCMNFWNELENYENNII